MDTLKQAFQEGVNDGWTMFWNIMAIPFVALMYASKRLCSQFDKALRRN